LWFFEGVSIVAQPVTHKVQITHVSKRYRKRKGFLDGLLSVDKFDHEVVSRPVANIYPKVVKFRLKISNHSKRVLRPNDAVVIFDIDGETISLSNKNYKNFLNALITPGKSKEVIISGPEIQALEKAKKGVLRFAIYELKTGNKLSNFEWYYNFKVEKKEEQSFTSRTAG